MSLENILNKITSDGQTEVASIRSEAEARVQEIKAQGEAEAEDRRQQINAEAEREADEYELPQLSVGKLEARKSRLLAQQEAVETCFTQALAELRSLSPALSQPMLKQLLLEAAMTGEEQIVVDQNDRQLYTSAFLAEVNSALPSIGKQGALSLADETRPTGGGFALLAGEIEINATFPTLLKALREELEPEVARILFQ